MKKLTLPATLLVAYLFTLIPAQQPSSPEQKPSPKKPAPQTSQSQSDDVVRITVNLVQIDVTVVDEEGRPVTDLAPEDFEVYEEGRAQKITNFSYVAPSDAKKTRPPSAAAIPLAGVTAKKTGKPVIVAPPTPPVRLKPEHVRRTVALVVDDLGLSQESSVRVRQALRKFVDEQLEPSDLVAIIRTGAGMGALQQFTTDKQQLHAAVDRVRYNLGSRSSVSTFAPIGGEGVGFAKKDDDLVLRQGIPATKMVDERAPDSNLTRPYDQMDGFREELFSVGTLGALNFVIRGLKDLPGRKSVVLFSDGFKLYTEDPGNRRILDSLNRLTDLANRASVVFYTIDPRGLEVFGITAADDTNGPINTYGQAAINPAAHANQAERLRSLNRSRGVGSKPVDPSWENLDRIKENITDRRNRFFETQQGLNFLAEQTGGFLVKNNNDIGGAVRRVMNDQSGFYLIAYRPDEMSFKSSARNFRSIDVKVKRSGLKVRTRSGFYNFTDEEARRPIRRSSAEQLFAALTSPFASGDMRLRMTAASGYDFERKTHFSQSLLHIDARDLVFKQQSGGLRQAVIELMAVTFGDSGKVVDMDDRAYTVSIEEQDFQKAQGAGLVYTVTLPIKKPGAYQLRIAVRDTANGRTGSANQFINVADVRKGSLTLSGLTLRGTSGVAGVKTTSTPDSAGVVSNASTAAGQAIEQDPHVGPAGRRLRRGMILEYGYFIYNAQVDKATQRPQLVTNLRLFRDGRLVYQGKVKDFDGGSQSNPKHLTSGGSLQLGKDLLPGEYVLQVVVYDRLAKEERALASQWIDFDIVD